MKAKRKSIEIEYVRFVNGSVSEVLPWVTEGLNKNPMDTGSLFRFGNVVFIQTEDGERKAKDGDYIIKDANGDIYPCKAEVFERTFETF